MTKKRYSCDGGSICIGTKASRANFINDFGDGEFYVYVCSRTSEINNKEWKFRGCVEGTNINVYSYDCLTNNECDDRKNILFTLSGRFGVYALNGNIALERWA